MTTREKGIEELEKGFGETSGDLCLCIRQRTERLREHAKRSSSGESGTEASRLSVNAGKAGELMAEEKAVAGQA